MSVAVTYETTVTVVETLETNVVAAAASGKAITHNGFNTSKSLSSGSTPPAVTHAKFELTLSSGTGTINLAALPGTNGATIDGTGMKLQVLKVKGKLGNANPITVAVGASNGYEFLGADFNVSVKAVQEVCCFGNDGAPDVASGARTFDVTGTGSQVLQVECVLG